MCSTCSVAHLTFDLSRFRLPTLLLLSLSDVPPGPGEEMGAKASLFEVSEHSAALPSPTLENIQAAYEGKRVEVARELLQQACCVECSAGMPRVRGVSPHKNWTFKTLCWLITRCHRLTVPQKGGS